MKRRNVKILLVEDHEHLGNVGEVVEVRPGYARNFLIPRKQAVEPTPDALRRVDSARKRAAVVRAERSKRLDELAKSIEGVSLTMEQRASEEGHLFGSVGADEVLAALRAKGVPVEAKQIDLERPIKELGIFTVTVRVDAERKANVRVWVIEPGT